MSAISSFRHCCHPTSEASIIVCAGNYLPITLMSHDHCIYLTGPLKWVFNNLMGLRSKNYQRSALLAFVKGIHRWLVVSLHNGTIMWKWCVHHLILRSSYLHNGISYTGKTIFLYWMKTVDVYYHIYSMWPSDAIHRPRSRSTLAQVMACCLTAPSHNLDQCSLIISKVQGHSYEGDFTRNISAIS